MADITFNQFLIAAFRHILYKDPNAQTFKYLNYHLPYSNRGNIRGIFEYARRILPSVYTHNFPNTEKGNRQMAQKVIENLDRKLDTELLRDFNPNTAREINPEIIEEVKTVSQQMDVQTTPKPPPRMQIPKIPTEAGQAAKGLGSKAGIFFKKNIGKHLTVGRIATGVSAGIGAVAGASFGPVGAIAGGFGGALLPSWIKNEDAGRFFSRVGNGVLDAGGRLSLQAGRGRSLVAKGATRWIWIFLGVFFLFIVGSGVIGALPQDIPTDQIATPVTQPDSRPETPTPPSEEEVPAPVVPPPIEQDNFAVQLANKIKQSISCNGFVSKFNYQACLESIQPIPKIAADEIVFSVDRYDYLQCVGFVKAITMNLTNQPGNAIDYSTYNIPGYRFIPRHSGDIQLGDLPVWNTGKYGHMAYVIKVLANGRFYVAEANFCSPDCGKVDNERYDSITNDKLVGWLRKNE